MLISGNSTSIYSLKTLHKNTRFDKFFNILFIDSYSLKLYISYKINAVEFKLKGYELHILEESLTARC